MGGLREGPGVAGLGDEVQPDPIPTCPSPSRHAEETPDPLGSICDWKVLRECFDSPPRAWECKPIVEASVCPVSTLSQFTSDHLEVSHLHQRPGTTRDTEDKVFGIDPTIGERMDRLPGPPHPAQCLSLDLNEQRASDQADVAKPRGPTEIQRTSRLLRRADTKRGCKQEGVQHRTFQPECMTGPK